MTEPQRMVLALDSLLHWDRDLCESLFCSQWWPVMHIDRYAIMNTTNSAPDGPHCPRFPAYMPISKESPMRL